MRLFTSESVTPGHPDKLCDQISDAILDAYLAEDPTAHVAVEVFASALGITIGGEVASTATVDREAVVRRVIAHQVGHTAVTGISPATQIWDQVVAQSTEIAEGVQFSRELREGAAVDGLDVQGAGDQGLMFGYATDETPQLMPMPAVLAHALARALTMAREDGTVTSLRPDGKTQVTVAYGDSGLPSHVDTVLVSTQHDPYVTPDELKAAVTEHVIDPVLRWAQRQGVRTDGTNVIINPSGSFVLGGPAADAGLTGRKIIVDTYGGMARHGGGAFSGKDPSKVDRSAAYAMRWVAKTVVAAGLASRCEVQVAYAIGQAQPVGLYVECFGTERVQVAAIEAGIRAVFDLRPAAIIRDLDLLRPIYGETATFGHFGVDGRPWESMSRVHVLRAAVDAARAPQAAIV